MRCNERKFVLFASTVIELIKYIVEIFQARNDNKLVNKKRLKVNHLNSNINFVSKLKIFSLYKIIKDLLLLIKTILTNILKFSLSML